jgi:hypothetical protein
MRNENGVPVVVLKYFEASLYRPTFINYVDPVRTMERSETIPKVTFETVKARNGCSHSTSQGLQLFCSNTKRK